MRAGFELNRVLVTVKTYPNPSMKHDETVCTAGITGSGEWVRMYPVPYRYLPPEKQYKKWQWMEIALAERGYQNDPRPESREPDVNTIRLLGEPLPTNDRWRQRREIIDAMPHHTLGELEELWDARRLSLGIIRPSEVLDLEVSAGDEKWSAKHEAMLAQPLLFGKRKGLRRIPYRFRYVFRCPDSPDPHKLTVEDWELGVRYLRERRGRGSERAAVQAVRDVFLGHMCASDRDTRFFVGTHSVYNTWLVIGVFYPPRDRQPRLF